MSSRLSDEARALVLEGAQKYIDTQEEAAGGVVTGFVLIVESAAPDGS